MAQKKRIFVLGLGGTIACKVALSHEEFYSNPSIDVATHLSNLTFPEDNLEFTTEQFAQKVSEDLSDNDILQIVKKIQKIIDTDQYDGIVVTQGTDVIEEVSYFTNLLVKTEIPIVFTGAMKPFNANGFDGARNLFNAIIIATTLSAREQKVLVTFNDCIYSSRNVQKINPSIHAAFSGNDISLLGYVVGNKAFFYNTCVQQLPYEFSINALEQLPEVYIIYGHIGVKPFFVEAAVENKVKGLISAGMGNGHQPKIVNEALSAATKKGIPVVRCSRTGQGVITRNPSFDDRYGFIAGGSLSPQKARLLLALILTKTNDHEEIQRMFDKS